MLQFITTLFVLNRDELATRDDRGASAVEYCLLVAAIAALIVVIVFALGGVVKEVFTDTCSEIKAKATSVSASCAASGSPLVMASGSASMASCFAVSIGK